MTRTQPDGIVRPRIAPGDSLTPRLRTLLEDLTGRTISLHVTPPDLVASSDLADLVIARYGVQAQRGNDPDRYLLVNSSAMAVLGGARAMLSHGAVEDALCHKQWSEALVDNCLDMLINIAQLWDRPDRPVRLSHTYGLGAVAGTAPGSGREAGSKLPDDVRVALTRPTSRLDLEVAVAGYGRGKMALLWA